MKKHAILLVDDEERIIRTLDLLLNDTFTVYKTTQPEEALAIVQQHHIAIIISDQRMPNMLGSELLAKVRVLSPHTLRILLTGYSDLNSAIQAVNEGEIFKYLTKPWINQELKQLLLSAVHYIERPPQQAVHTPYPHSNTPRLNCLVLDDTRHNAELIAQLLGDTYKVMWAKSLETATRAIIQHEIAILVTDLHINAANISPFLRSLKREKPYVLTIVTTDFSNTEAIMELINQSKIFRCLPKPLPKGLLSRSLKAGFDKHLQLKNDLMQQQLEHVHAIAHPQPETAVNLFYHNLIHKVKASLGLA